MLPQHLFFHVQLAPTIAAPASGRLLVFIQPDAEAKKGAGPDGKIFSVESSPFHESGASVSARDVDYILPGHIADIDTDHDVYPTEFSNLPPGDYDAQAVLDVNRDYNYNGRTPGDLLSDVITVHIAANMADGPTLTLNHAVPQHTDPWVLNLPPNIPEAMKARVAQQQTMMTAAKSTTDRVDFHSNALTKFWGRDITMHAWILLPPGYKSGSDHYPTVYFTHGYGAKFDNLIGYVGSINDRMVNGKIPPMIWVFLDESSATGTHEFADGVNNGPWGEALTTELIPYLESQYRMDGRVNSRFLNGHSSGGWATLWLQVRYPKVFGGTWSTSPDPSDFHDFTGIDLYAPNANVYHRTDGTQYPIMRDKGQVMATFESFAKYERVIGPYGGQLASFEWVFSPRGPDGRPVQIFNRNTGDVDPAVVAYWRDHYDIVHIIKTRWPELKPDLDGKIHVIVGTADTFYLDGAAHLLDSALKSVGANATITFLPDRTHFDLYAKGSDRLAMMEDIAWQMYAVARPGSKSPNPPVVLTPAP
jgi:enterochelin esterase-like enzyme